jgi:hypothetical protein
MLKLNSKIAKLNKTERKQIKRLNSKEEQQYQINEINNSDSKTEESVDFNE